MKTRTVKLASSAETVDDEYEYGTERRMRTSSGPKIWSRREERRYLEIRKDPIFIGLLYRLSIDIYLSINEDSMK